MATNWPKLAAFTLLTLFSANVLAQSTSLKGAGATFPYPLYAKWFANYQRQNPSVQITYDAIGSEAGMRKLLAGSVDFGASDNPEVLHETAPASEDKYIFLPTAASAVVPIVNLPGFPSDIKFTPECLAGIYLGKIQKWNDPLLKSANRGLSLPDLEIVVIHRADGSGTSYVWTDFLSKTNPEWKEQVGSGLAPHWPVGRGATGNEGVAKLVKEVEGSIGYVGFIYALRNHLSFGKVRNQKGSFVSADLDSITAAVTGAVTLSSDLKTSAVNAPVADAYPITSFTWFVLPAHIENESKRRLMKDFLIWMLGPGQRQAAALGYVSLPAAVVEAERAAVMQIN